MEEKQEVGMPKTATLTSKRKLPEVPDFSGQFITPKKPSPFILDDFRGSDAYTKPA